MAHLPTPGGDDGSWGTVLNDFLSVGHDPASGEHVYMTEATGAIERHVVAKLDEMVSVKDFGAVGDGVTDDTSAILAAIAYAVSLRVANTAPITVWVPPGIYLFTARLTLGHKIKLQGAGRWASQLKLGANITGDTGAIRLDDPAYSPGSFQHGNAVCDLTLNCQGFSTVGVYGENINEGGGLYNVRILGWTLYGFHAADQYCLNYAIEHSELHSGYGSTAGKIAVYIDRGNHPLFMRSLSVSCYNGDTSISTGSIGIYYAPGSSDASDGDVNCGFITDCYASGCLDGIKIWQARVSIINISGDSDVTNTIHWANRAAGSSALIVNKNPGGYPVKDSTTTAIARNSSQPLLLASPPGGRYYTETYFPGAVLTGGRRSYAYTATPNASGNIDVPHDWGATPLYAIAGISSSDGKKVSVASRTGTYVRIHVRTAAGAIYTAGPVTVWVTVIL